MSFIDDIKAGIEVISRYVQMAIDILTRIDEDLPGVVQWALERVEWFMGLIEKGDATPEGAKKILAAEGQAKFHGSGQVVTTQIIETAIENAVTVVKAKRGKVYTGMEEKAEKMGYLNVPKEIEKAVEAMPNFMPVKGKEKKKDK